MRMCVCVYIDSGYTYLPKELRVYSFILIKEYTYTAIHTHILAGR